MAILGSASKIVFILMAIGVILLTSMHILDAKDFMILASMAFSYYFTQSTPRKPDDSQ